MTVTIAGKPVKDYSYQQLGPKGFLHHHKEPDTEEWYTPGWVFDKLKLKFDIDVAAPIGGVPWIPAKKFYTKEDDGMVQDWAGNIWLAPPYNDTYRWIRRMHIRHNLHGVTGVGLFFAQTDTKWFHEYATKATALLFLRERIKFIMPNGQEAGSPANGSVLVAWGQDNAMALATLSNLGLFVCP